MAGVATAPGSAGPARVAATGLPTPAAGADEARRTAEQVLARPEYAEARPSLLERAWQALLEGLGELIGQLGGVAGSELIGVAVLAVAVGAVGWVVVTGLRRLRPSADRDEGSVGPQGRDAADWRGEAADHEAAGAWREAVRCRYRALLAELVAAGRVDDVPGRTPREHLAQAAAGDPGLRAPLTAATTTFETAWYTDAPVARDDAAQVAAATDEVRTRLTAGVRGGA